MVEGKLRKLSQIDSDLLGQLMFAQNADQYVDYDEFTYIATPADHWDTQGDNYDLEFGEGQVALRTGNMDGDGAWIAKNADTAQPLIGTPLDVSWRAALQTTADMAAFIGLLRTLATEANPPVEPTDGYYFRVINGAMAGNWEAVKMDTGVETAQDTGILSDDDPHWFRIIDDGVNVKFYIDGVLVATTTTVSTGSNCRPAAEIVTQTAGAAEMYVDTYRILAQREF